MMMMTTSSLCEFVVLLLICGQIDAESALYEHGTGYTVRGEKVTRALNLQQRDRLNRNVPLVVDHSSSSNSVCDFCLYDGFGNITSYGYPLRYANNLVCTYRVERTDQDTCELSITFHDFDVEQSSFIQCKDYLMVGGKKYCGPQWKGRKESVKFPRDESEITFYFRTDSEGQRRGFWIEIQQARNTCEETGRSAATTTPSSDLPPPPTCHFCTDSMEGRLTSYLHPNVYRNNMSCVYEIERQPGYCTVAINFDDFDVEKSFGCSKDYLEVDGQKYCGNELASQTRMVKFGSNKKIRMNFVTDSANTRGGFSFDFKQGLCPSSRSSGNCDQLYTDRDTIIKSPNYPDNYDDGADCKYTIMKADEDICSLRVTFAKFDVESGKDCEFDYLQVNGQKLCGQIKDNTQKTFDFRTNQKTLVFHSDSASSRPGFAINVKQERCKEPRKTEMTSTTPRPNRRSMCQYRYTNLAGSFDSPMFKDGYPNDLDCSFEFFKQDGFCNVELTFDEFMLEGSVGCNMDYVMINGRKHCGNQLRGSKITIPFENGKYETGFKFVTNDRTTSPGFKGTYHQIECGSSRENVTAQPSTSGPTSRDLCDETITAINFEIKSPNYPQQYPNNRKCRYTIRRKDSNICKLELTFLKFNLESSRKCEYDYLEIDGERLCGRLPSRKISMYDFEGFEKVIEFNSDEASSREGFMVQGRQVECLEGRNESPKASSKCEKIHEGIEFDLTSPNYPSPYVGGQDCWYTIRRANANICQLVINVQAFDVSASTSCNKDFLEIDNEKLCGILPPGTTRSYNFRTSQKVLRFRTDKFSSGKGFQIRVQQRECSFQTSGPIARTTRPSRVESCDKTFSGSMFEILSPSFPGKYPNAASCNYMINKLNSNICKLEVDFMRFDVESSENCQYDFLEIDGKRLCGTIPEGTTRELDFRNDRTTFKFQSDEASGRMGFLLRVIQKECDAVSIRPMVRSEDPISCDSTYDRQTFNVRSPGYPESYPNNVTCRYTVVKINDLICKLRVTYNDFDVESSDQCSYDHLEIYNEKLCGVIQPETVREFDFLESRKILAFRTDEATNRKGFDLSIEQVECERSTLPTLPPASRRLCDEQFSSTSFHITSPNYPSNYPVDAMCIYRIRKANQEFCSVDMNILQFDVGSSGRCTQDYFQVEGDKICGFLSRGSKRTLNFDGDEILLKFKAGSEVSRPGFQIEFQQNRCTGISRPPVQIEPPKNCNINLSRRQFTLTSPNYPEEYENNADCVYTIEKAENVCTLQLQFVNFELEESANCGRDYIEIDGARFCGRFAPNTTREVPFDSPVKRMIFHTNSRVTNKGFEINVSQVSCKEPTSKEGALPSAADPKCSATYQQSSFQIKSPNFPNVYPNRANCQYVLRKSRPDICQLEMKFNSFEIEGSTNCTADYLDIMGMRICGAMPAGRTKHFEFVGEEMIVSFKTDEASSRQGFDVQVTQIPCGSTDRPDLRSPIPPTRRPLSGCENNFYADSGDFRSENHPKNYPDNFDCMYQFLKQDGFCALELSFEDFSLETSNDCTTDYVSIDGKKYCGTQLKGQTVSIPFNGRQHVSFVFMSDDRDNDRGFAGRYRLLTCESATGRSSGQSCDVITDAADYELISPGYPERYRNQQDCKYVIQKMRESVCGIEITFETFDVESSEQCSDDYLQIDGQKLCGNLPAKQKRVLRFAENEDKKVFLFHSDDATSRAGFHVNIKQIEQCGKPDSRSEATPPPPLCDFCLHNETGYITSLGYPESYPNNVYCSYRIEAIAGYCSVRVFFNEFDLENSNNCQNDFFEIQGQKFCGTNLLKQRFTFDFPRNSEIKFMFVTNGRTTGKGFHAEFTQQRCQGQPGPGFRAGSLNRSTTKKPNGGFESRNLKQARPLRRGYGGHFDLKSQTESKAENKIAAGRRHTTLESGNRFVTPKTRQFTQPMMTKTAHYVKTGVPGGKQTNQRTTRLANPQSELHSRPYRHNST
ncbi:Uncharacterised protein g2655 [Pycnogonum litorale]